MTGRLPVLANSRWQDWLRNAPAIETDPAGDTLNARVTQWLDQQPQLPAATGQPEPLSNQDRMEARLALLRYRLDLLEEATTLSAPSLQALNQGMLSLGASICGSAIAVKLGVAVAVAGSVSSAAVALVALGYGVLTISRGASAYRRRNILRALAKRLAAIEDNL